MRLSCYRSRCFVLTGLAALLFATRLPTATGDVGTLYFAPISGIQHWYPMTSGGTDAIGDADASVSSSIQTISDPAIPGTCFEFDPSTDLPGPNPVLREGAEQR